MRPLTAALLTAVALGCASGASSPPATQPGAPAPSPGTPPEREPAQPVSPPEGAGVSTEEGEAVGVRRLGSFRMTAIATAERLVIRDDSSYATLWSRLGGGRRPPVDFGREVVAAAAAGPGAGAISMGRAVRRNDSLLIEVVRSVPSADCPSSEASSHPVAVVALQTGAIKGWGFVEREQVGGCGF